MCIVLLFLLCVSTTQASVEYGNFVFDGNERDYMVFNPENFEAGLPLVLNLHGYTCIAQNQMDWSGMNLVADTATFIVAYPNTVAEKWNSGIVE